MNLFSIDWQQGWELVGWIMCYFLAIGTLVALVGAALRFAIRRTSPTVRYAWSLTVLTLLSVTPIVIGAWLWPQLPAPPLLAIDTPPTIDLKDLEPPRSTRVIPPSPDVDFKIRELAPPTTNLPILQYPPTEGPFADPLMPTDPTWTPEPSDDSRLDMASTSALVIRYLPWLWIVGTPLTFLLLTTGLIGSHRLRKHSKLITEGPIAETCARLRAALSISRRVRIAFSERIVSPLLVGIVRPVILLPPAALTGWTPEELEMVLLHELAHVRRWDNLVNLLQRTIESLLFFHPCIWWVSRWVRRDREECCDAIVVSQTAEPRAYAELLVALATPNQPLAGLAMAQHPLAGRIRKILKLEDETMLVSRGTIGLAGVALASLLVAVLWTPVDSSVAKESVAEEEVAAESKTQQAQTIKDVEFAGLPDAEELSELLKVDEWHPAITVRYAVNEQYSDQIANIFKGMANDPYGPRLKIDWRWSEQGETLAIKAPVAAHKKFFEPIFKKWGKDAAVEGPVGSGVKRANTSKPSYTTPKPEQKYVIVYALRKNERVPIAEWTELLNRQRGPMVKLSRKNDSLVVAANEDQHKMISDLLQQARTSRREAEFSPVSNTASPFPTLEEQRAADLAYKLLQLELESLSKEELTRVKEQGFAGGLRVAGGVVDKANGVKLNDLLVGLHVWPTTSLADVKQVLQRDDLAELSPLKFYVIRKTRNPQQLYGGEYGGYGGGMAPEVEYVDELVTGRIMVSVAAIKRKSSDGRTDSAFTDKYVLSPGDRVKVVATGVYPDQPLDDLYVIEPMGTLPLGPTYGRIKVVGLSLEEAEKKVQSELSKILQEPRVQITLYETSEQRQAAARNPYQSSSYPPTRPMDTTLDESGESREQQYAEQSSLVSQYDQYLDEIDERISAVEQSYREVKAQRDQVHDQWLEQEQNGKVDQKLRDKFTTLDLRTQKLNRQLVELKQERQRVFGEQTLWRSVTNALKSGSPQRTLESTPLGGVATPSTQPLNSLASGWQDPDRNTKPPAQSSTTDSSSPPNPTILPPVAQDRYSPVSPAQDPASTYLVPPPLESDPLDPQPKEQSILTSSRPTQTFPRDTTTSLASQHQAEQSAKQESPRNQLFDEAVRQDPTLQGYQAEEFAYKQQIAELRRDEAQDNSAQLRRLQAGLDALQQESLQYRSQLANELNRRRQPQLSKSPASLEHLVQIAEIELRYAQAAYEVAKKDFDVAVEHNRQHKGAVVQQEIERLGLEAKRAKLRIERAEVELDALKEQAKSEEQPTLLYDDKTFDQWRSLWKNELKTEKRTEAIKALAAFGRAGYGEEAAEAIFEVAEQYDFSTWGSGSAEEQVLEVLNNNANRRLKASVWLPILLKHYQSEPETWKKLVEAAIPGIAAQSIDDQTRDLLIELAHGENKLLQGVALGGLSGCQVDDTEIKKLVDELITSEDPETVVSAVSLNHWYPQNFRSFGDQEKRHGKVRSMDALIQGLLHENLTVRQRSRERLRFVDKSAAAKIVALMTKDLETAQDDRTRLIALRTSAVLNDIAISMSDQIYTFTDEQQSPEVRVAAVFAFMRIETESAVFQHGFVTDMQLGEFRFGEREYHEEHERTLGERYLPNPGGGGFF